MLPPIFSSIRSGQRSIAKLARVPLVYKIVEMTSFLSSLYKTPLFFKGASSPNIPPVMKALNQSYFLDHMRELPFTKLPQTKQTDALTWLWASFHIGLPKFCILHGPEYFLFNQKGAFSNSMTVTEMDSSYTLQHKISQLLIQNNVLIRNS
jgi:hypothetical protein